MTARERTGMPGVVLLAALAMAGSAHAQSRATHAEGLPYNTVERAGHIEYVTGGIGEGAEQRLHAFARERGYNLKLVFALNAGNYVADVDVVLKDRSGRTLVEDVADGPLFLARVPAGVYTVAATYNGRTETRKVRAGAGGMRAAHFRWPADPETDVTLAHGARDAGRGAGS